RRRAPARRDPTDLPDRGLRALRRRRGRDLPRQPLPALRRRAEPERPAAPRPAGRQHPRDSGRRARRMSGRRLVYLCDWLPPEFGAVGQYALAEAQARAAGGERVTLVGLATRADAVSEERLGAGHLTVIRLATSVYDRADLFARLLWTLGTNLRLVAAALPAL